MVFSGTSIMALVEGDPHDPIVKGFRVIEQFDKDTMKLWAAYVAPEYRRQGVYNRLLESAKAEASKNGCRYLTVATDTCETNPMNDILLGKGFTLSSRTYCN